MTAQPRVRRRRGRSWPVAVAIALAATGCSSSCASDHGSQAGAAGASGAGAVDPTGATGAARAPAVGEAGVACERQPFARDIPIAEASGAVYVPASGDRTAYLVVVGDSGTLGQVVEIDLRTGAPLRTGRLPLESPRRATDDLEGLARVGGVYYAITSAGWVREWTLRDDGKGYQIVRGPYAIAPWRQRAEDLVCHPHRVNCGRNYEGLCLRDAPADDACAGFAASKTDGVLYCVVRDGGDDAGRDPGRLRIDPARSLRVTTPGVLTGCHFTPDDPDGPLWVGTNLFAGSRVYQVRGWRDLERAELVLVGSMGSGFPEALAVAPGGVVYRLSDTGGHPSAVDRYVCR